MQESPDSADTTFRQLLNREILVSERRRMLSLAAMLAVILALILMAATFAPVLVRSIYHDRLPVRKSLTVFPPFIAYELLAAAFLTILLRRGRNFPVFGRYANALIETSFPTLLLYLLAGYLSAPVIFGAWPALLYFLFIGIAAVRGLPETVERNRLELALQLALGPALVSRRGFGDAEASTGYQRAAELARRLGDDRDRFAATWGLWITIRAKSASDHMRLRLQYLGEMVEAAERAGDAELLLQAHHSSWSTRIWNGEFASASEHVRSGLALYDPERHRHHALMYGGHDPGVCGNGQGAVVLWELGWPDRAVQSARESIVLGETLDHLPSLLHSLWFATSVYFLRRQAADVLACNAQLLALGSEHGLKLYEAIGGVFHGWALIQQLDAQAGLAELRAAVATYATTAHVNLDLYRAILVEAELRAGNFEEGKAVLIQGERSTDEWWRAGYLRLRGDLLLRGPNDDRGAAERLYRQAISVAAGQQAKSVELRAATSLAMLLGEQGRRSEGYAVLAPVYGWFTEGFGTLDLKEAKALLGELHA